VVFGLEEDEVGHVHPQWRGIGSDSHSLQSFSLSFFLLIESELEEMESTLRKDMSAKALQTRSNMAIAEWWPLSVWI